MLGRGESSNRRQHSDDRLLDRGGNYDIAHRLPHRYAGRPDLDDAAADRSMGGSLDAGGKRCSARGSRARAGLATGAPAYAASSISGVTVALSRIGLVIRPALPHPALRPHTPT